MEGIERSDGLNLQLFSRRPIREDQDKPRKANHKVFFSSYLI